MRKRWNLLLFFVLFLCSSMQVRAAGIGKDAGQLVGVAEHGAATYGDAAEHSIAAPYTQSTQNPGAAFITSAGMTLANGTAYPLTMVRHALTVDSSGGAAIWKSEFPLGANLALAGNTLTVDVGYPLRFVGGSRFDSLGGLTSSHATTKALVFLDPTVDKIVGNNAPAIGTEKGASFAMGNNAGATSISWSQDGVLLAMSHEGDNSTPDQGDVKIAEFVTDGFTLASNAAWINSAESVADNAFGEATADQRFMVIRFRPIPPNPDDANPKYVVAVGSKGATNNIQVKVFQTSGNAGSKDVAHSANRNVSNSPVAQADTVVAMEWNRKGDKLAVAYIDDSDSSNYKVVVFSADANGNLSSPGTPLNINDASTGVAGATLKEHSIAWAKDDQLMIAFGHSENSGTLRAYRVDFANNAIFRADRTASLIAPNVSAIAYHPTQSVFAAAVDSTGVKLYGYTNDQITLLNEANQTITLAATFNDLQWHPSGKILTIAANGQGTKSYPYDLAAQSLDAANPISNFSLGGSNNVKFVAWDPTSQFFARHKAAATADVQAVSAGAPKGTLTRIILVLNRDITINDRFEIADDCEIQGNGFKITMEPSAKITINNGKTLTLKNCTLKGVRGNPGLFNIIDNIEFSNDSSTLRLENSVIIPTSHVRMTGGKIVEVGQNSYIDQRFAPFEFTNRGTMFQKEHETIGGNFGGDFEFNSQSHYDPTTGKTVEIMSGSTIPSGNTIDTGKMPDAIALPQATIGGVATNFNKAIHGASWSIDGQHVAFIHTGDRSLDPGLLRIDAFQPDSNSGAGALVLKYDARSDAAAANPVQISLATTSGEVKFVAFRPKFKSDATGNEYTLALARNNPPSGTPNVQIFKYIPTAGQENERIIAQKKIGTETITGITLASGDVKAMVWDKEGKHLALITDEPKLRIYQYDGVAGQFTEIGSGITCATPSLDGQLFWGREGKKLFYAGKGGENGGDGVYQVFLFSDSGIRNVTDDTTTFTSAPGIRLALHPTEDTLAVSTNGGNDSVVKLLSYDSIGKITDAEGTVTTKGTDKTITGEETVTSLEWEPSGQGLFVVSDDSNASPKIHAYEYDNKAGKLLDDFAQNANFASIVTNKTLVKWAPGALFVGGEGSDGNDRAAVQKMGKKPAVSKTGGETSLSTEHTAIIADFNLESGTWTITGGNNAMRVLEIMHHAVVTIKSGATLHLKNLRLRGLFAPPPNPASKTINLCENLKIEGGGTLKLENVVVEVFGDVRFDRSNAAGDNATIAFTGSNSKIIAPGGFGSFVVGSNWTLDNLGSATGATAGNMTVTFESGTKVESSVSTIKAISSLIPASNIETPSGGSFEFAVQDVRVGAAHAVDMFRQMRERMEGDTSRGMQFSFNLQAGATGIPRQDLPGGDSRDNPQIITVGRDKVLGAQGEGDMTMTGHSKIILGGGDANANVELTRLEAASRSKITIDTDATVVVSGKGTIKLHDASMVLKKGAKFQVGAAATDQIVVDLRNADLTLKEEGSRFTFGSGTHSLLVDQSTINCKKGTIEFNADMDGKAVSDGTVTEISITDSTITGKNDVALIFYKNKVTNGAEAKTTLTLNANKTSGMRVKFGDQVDLLTPEVSDDVEAEQVPMCCCVEKLGTPVNAKNTGAKTKAVTGEMVVVDSDTGKFYGLRPDDLNHHGMQVINNRKKIHIIDKNVRAQYQDVETGEREPA